MRFLANENFPVYSVHWLRRSGHDVAAVIEDSPGASDGDVLQRAVLERRIILTFDRDYGELVYRRARLAPAGVVYFRFNPLSPEEPAECLLQLLSVQGLSLQDRFTVAERGRVRQRPLPRPLHSG
jgi:predicted nuclease of predicted toxin-antitoxin system